MPDSAASQGVAGLETELIRAQRGQRQITGHVDFVSERWVIGWIADKAAPHNREPVLAQAPGGQPQAFLPYVPRADVATFLGVDGLFGFAIPTAALAELGPNVSLLDRNGAVLPGGDCLTLRRRRMAADRPSYVFLHIPKTGGTSLRNTLAAGWAPGDAAFIYAGWPHGLAMDELARLHPAQRRSLRFVIGHMPYGAHECLPNAAGYLTVLRKADAQIRSNYHHHALLRRRGETGGSPMTLARDVTDGADEQFDNLQVRLLADCPSRRVPLGQISEAHVDLALHRLRSAFRFIALTEEMDRHFPLMCESMGIECPLPAHDNVTQERADETAVNWAEVLHRNRFDAMLYDRVRNENLAGRILQPASGWRAAA